MKKILIIAYFFPPSNFVGGARIKGWVHNLYKFGYYPIVITRQWNYHQNELTDKVQHNQYSIDKYDKYEVHRMPYRRTFRDLFAKYPKFWILQKSLTFLEIILSSIFIKSLPFSNFYKKSKEIIIKNSDIKYCICSGRPFQSFFIGYKLQKKYKIKFIPDYRDEWNSHKNLNSKGLLNKILNKIHLKCELKWTKNCAFFISVSKSCVYSISKLIDIKGYTILNGFDDKSELININSEKKTDKEFVITYAGTLYEYQKIEILISSIQKLDSGLRNKIKVYFIGVNMIPKEYSRIKKLIEGSEDTFIIKERIPKKELIKYYKKTDLLFLTGYEKNKGWFPVKLIEYYITNIPMLLCPSDNGEMENFIKESNCGFIANNIEDCEKILVNLIEKNNENKRLNPGIEKNILLNFSQKNQTKELVYLLNIM